MKVPVPDPMGERLWFEDYFDEAYEQVYSKHLLPVEQTREEAQRCLELLGFPAGGVVVDIACGFGRHARLMARGKVQVVALDLNRHYVEKAARGRRRVLGLGGDMRALPLASGSCDGGLLLFNSFGYFGARELWESGRGGVPPVRQGQVWKLPSIFYDRQLVSPDFGKFTGTAGEPLKENLGRERETVREACDRANRQVLEEAARVLKVGGRFVLELSNPAEVMAAVREAPRRHMIGQGFELMEEYAFDAEVGVLHGRTSFVLPQATRHSEYWVRLYSLRELRDLFRQVGLSVLDVFGNGSGDPYRRGSSPGLWMVGEKKSRSRRGNPSHFS
jgi:SAM-dependent methyltransferase